MKKLLCFVLCAILFFTAAAQPGYSITSFSFALYKEDNLTPIRSNNYIMEWRVTGKSIGWKKSNISNGVFYTDPMRSDINALELKIYHSNGNDTMHVHCAPNLHRVPFIAGQYRLNRSQCYLANMEALNGTSIINQDWQLFKINNSNKYYLPQQRAYYFPKEYDYIDEKDPAIQTTRYNSSAHLKLLNDQGIEDHINLNKLYYTPQQPGSVYCIGYVDGNDKTEKFDAYLMESTDHCNSWKIKSPLPENTTDLIFVDQLRFGVAQSYPSNALLIFDFSGRLITSEIKDESPSSWPENIFVRNDGLLRSPHPSGNEMSDPMMNRSNMPHLFHRQFTNDGKIMVRIDSLPYYPVSIHISGNSGLTWNTTLQLNSKETYAYITMRKNKLVLLSYHYTMVSTDFGLSWTFYENPSFSGGEWNFIWLDDDTLVNVTQHYADYFTIK